MPVRQQDRFDAAFFLRNVLSQGGAIYQDYASRPYEEYARRLDCAAIERAAELASAMSAVTTADETVKFSVAISPESTAKLIELKEIRGDDSLETTIGKLLNYCAKQSAVTVPMETYCEKQARKAIEHLKHVFHEDEPSPLMQPEEDDIIRDEVLLVCEVLTAHLHRHILYAGRDATRDAGWRPIETAPKDGTALLAFSQINAEDGYGPKVFVARWWEAPKHHRKGSGWVDHGGYSQDFTHWQPLPAIPATPAKGE